MSHRKQVEELEKLLGQVKSVKVAASLEYEQKLKSFLIQRANQMKHGIFDGVKLPKVKRNVDGLREKLQENQRLTQKAQMTTEKYFYAKSASEHLRKELNDTVETLKKFQQIQQTMQNDDA